MNRVTSPASLALHTPSSLDASPLRRKHLRGHDSRDSELNGHLMGPVAGTKSSARRLRMAGNLREKDNRQSISYHHRPHSRLNYKTPREVAALWKDPDDHLIPAA